MFVVRAKLGRKKKKSLIVVWCGVVWGGIILPESRSDHHKAWGCVMSGPIVLLSRRGGMPT